jgi:HEAT repeat protein
LVLALGCAPRAAPPRAAQVEATQAAVPRATPADLAEGRHLFGWLINGDTETRHRNNVDAAAKALGARGATKEHVFISDARAGNVTTQALAKVATELSATLGHDDQLVVYVTGHGAPEGIVLQDEKVLGRAELLEILRPLRDATTIFVFDGCFTGALPARLLDDGFHAMAMAPDAEGEESYCQLFAPAFWGTVELGAPRNGDMPVSIRDVFLHAMEAYNTGRKNAGLAHVAGTYVAPVPEAQSVAEIARGCAVVEVTAAWCGACKAQRRELAYLDLYRGEGVRVFTVDSDQGPLKSDITRILGHEVTVLPTLAFLKDGRLVEAKEGGMRAASVLARLKETCGVDATGLREARAAVARRLEAPDEATRLAAIEAMLSVDAVDDDVVRAFRRIVEPADTVKLRAIVDRLEGLPAFASLSHRLGETQSNRIFEQQVATFKAALDRAIVGLSSQDAGERTRSARAIAELKHRAHGEGRELWSALRPLATAVVDADVNVRRAAVLAFALVTDETKMMAWFWILARSPSLSAPPRPYAAALELLLEDPEPSVRAAAAMTAGLLRVPDMIPALTRHAANDGSPLVRHHAALGLSVLPEKRSLPTLLRALDDADGTVQSAALTAIAWKSIGPKTDKQWLRAAMSRMPFRPELARAFGLLLPRLGNVHDGELFPILLRLYDEERFWAPVALVHVARWDARALPALLTRAKSFDPEVRKLAVWALARLPRSKTADAAIRAALADPNAGVREEAARGLAEASR